LDNLLLKYIRRANLDAFWSRATGTVMKECGNVKRNIEDLKSLGLSGPHYDPGPSPLDDSCGYEAAISLLVDSQRKGNYADDHKHWQSVHKLRSTISSFERVAFGMSRYALVADDNSATQRFQSGGTSSLWFNKFTKGIGERMGSEVRKDLGVSAIVFNRFLKRI